MPIIEVTMRYEVDGVTAEDLPLLEDHLENHARMDSDARSDTGFDFPSEMSEDAIDDATLTLASVDTRTLNEAWEDDHVQFPRLIEEIIANQELNWSEIRKSMDLTDAQLHELLDRAHDAWERIKEQICPSK